MTLESLTQIQGLIYGYAELIDSGDYEGIGKLFQYGKITTEDPENPGSQGYEQVLKLYQTSTRLYPDGTPLSKHLVTNLLIEIAPNDQTAKAKSYYTVLQRTDSLPLQPIITGKYKDSFAREPEAGNTWQFKERIMIVDQLGDLSQHLLFNLSGENLSGDS